MKTGSVLLVAIIAGSCRSHAADPNALSVHENLLAAYKALVVASAAALDAGRYDEAIIQAQTAEDLVPSRFEAFFVGSLAQLKAGDEKGADQALVRAFKPILLARPRRQPKDPGAGATPSWPPAADSAVDDDMRQGYMALQSEQYMDGFDSAREAIATDGGRFEGYALAALSLRCLGRREEVGAYIDQAMDRAPQAKAAALGRLRVPLVTAASPAGPKRAAMEAPSVLRQPDPRFPDRFLEDHPNGSVLVEFLVDPSGRVEDAFASYSTSPDLVAPSVALVGTWVFKPARVNGRPVYCHMEVPIVFGMRPTDNLPGPARLFRPPGD
jgi:tetratricopeptide (TPR) repeat protein